MSDRSAPPPPEPLPVAVHDDHTHLNFAPDAELWSADGLPLALPEAVAALDLAEAVGVRGVVQVGTGLEDSRWAVALAEHDPRVLAAVAIHPNDAPRIAAEGRLDDALAELDRLAARPRTRAIGETGMDFFRTGEDGVAAQRASFLGHIEIAKRHGLALQIHDRDAHEAIADLLDEVGAPERTVLHCFSGDAEFARRCVEAGYLLSFAGTVTFKNAPRLREALAVTPLDRILVETDAPFLTPEPYRGRPNSPYLIPFTLRRMAAELGLDVAELGTRVAANAERVYGPW